MSIPEIKSMESLHTFVTESVSGEKLDREDNYNYTTQVSEIIEKFGELYKNATDYPALSDTLQKIRILSAGIRDWTWSETVNCQISGYEKEMISQEPRVDTINRLMHVALALEQVDVEPVGLEKLDPNQPEDKKKLVELALMSARKLHSNIRNFLPRYRFDSNKAEDREVLLQIFQLACPQRNLRPSNFLQNFRFDGKDSVMQTRLLELAKLEAKTYEGEFLADVGKYPFDLENPDVKNGLVEILKSVISQLSQRNTLKAFDIKHFGLNPADSNDKKTIFEILKLGLSKNASEIIPELKSFGLTSESREDRLILLELVKQRFDAGSYIYKPEKEAKLLMAFIKPDLADPEERTRIVEIAEIITRISRIELKSFKGTLVDTLGIKEETIGFKQALLETSLNRRLKPLEI